MHFFHSKKNQLTSANVLPLFLPYFALIFLIQTLYVLLKGAQGNRSYATVSLTQNLGLFSFAEAGIVLNLFLNFEQK